jgi:hypothetical protein
MISGEYFDLTEDRRNSKCSLEVRKTIPQNWMLLKHRLPIIVKGKLEKSKYTACKL